MFIRLSPSLSPLSPYPHENYMDYPSPPPLFREGDRGISILGGKNYV